MITRNALLAVVTIAALSPTVSNATPERKSAHACADAFASTIAAPGSNPAYKLTFGGNTSSILEDFYPTNYTFTLEARDPKTGLAVARALCSTNSRGAVTAISAVPLTASVTKPAT